MYKRKVSRSSLLQLLNVKDNIEQLVFSVSCDANYKVLLIILLVTQLFAQVITTHNADNNRVSRCYDQTLAIKTFESLFPNLNVNQSQVNENNESARPNLNNVGWKCCCWNATSERILECRCEGMGILRMPQTITIPVQRLTVSSAGIPKLRRTGLKVYGNSLVDIALTDVKYLESIADGAFENLNLLRTIYISHAPRLKYLTKDVFLGISETIKIIRIINSGLLAIPEFTHFPPTIILQMLDFDNNHITMINKKSVKVKSDQLILANNDITHIGEAAFYGSQIARLSLRENHRLTDVHINAFKGLTLQTLDLSGTAIERLPTVGLSEIEELNIENAVTMKIIPSIYNFKNLQKAYLTHSFHCCAFKFPSRHDPVKHAEQMKKILQWQRKCGKFPNIPNTPYLFNIPETTNGTLSFNEPNESNEDLFSEVFNENFNSTDIGNINEDLEDNGIFHNDFVLNPGQEQPEELCGNFSFRDFEIDCYPAPNPLNPCEDVMGYKLLRIAVWLVVLLAVFGNISVLLVIFSVRSENMTVPRFLMCNLAFADLCLGLYLLLIASIDAYSIGEYFNYAYDWQYGTGCKVTGFITVFASHLSVFTLTIITIERWLAITYALRVNRRLDLAATVKIMIGGWLYSIFMASLPLFGISNYSSTSICLPMETKNIEDTLYLLIILGVNGLTFVVISICYSHIYFSLEKNTRNCTQPGEMTIAKKMALLVFTNFFCWAPIAFFGLTALAGYPLIDVTKSKILLVFFYPLNSCADPYLYAILTAQYRKDLYKLVSSIFKRNKKKYKNSMSFPETLNLTDTHIRKNSRISVKEPMIIKVDEVQV